MRTINTSLIDHLAQIIGCEYISDLPFMAAAGSVVLVSAVKQQIPEDYSLHDWNDALEYLVQSSAQNSVHDAYHLLLRMLEERLSQ